MNVKIGLSMLGLLAVTTFAQDSLAGCGITLNFINSTNDDIKVLAVESKMVGGTYSTVGTADVMVNAGKTVSRAYELNMGCGPTRIVRLKLRRGDNEYFQEKGPFVTAVDRKFDFVLNSR